MADAVGRAFLRRWKTHLLFRALSIRVQQLECTGNGKSFVDRIWKCEKVNFSAFVFSMAVPLSSLPTDRSPKKCRRNALNRIAFHAIFLSIWYIGWSVIVAYMTCQMDLGGIVSEIDSKLCVHKLSTKMDWAMRSKSEAVIWMAAAEANWLPTQLLWVTITITMFWSCCFFHDSHPINLVSCMTFVRQLTHRLN